MNEPSPSSSSSTVERGGGGGGPIGTSSGSATPPSPTTNSRTTSPSPNPSTGSLGRSSARRTLRQSSNDILSAHPLLASPPPHQNDLGASTGPGNGNGTGSLGAVAGGGVGGTYVVYSRSTTTGSGMPTRTSSFHQDDGSSTMADTLPSSPLTTAAPPLVSRPSNSTLPYAKPSARNQDSSSSSMTTTTRAYARSISEAQEKLQGQQLKAEVQALGLGNDSVGAMMVNRLVSAFVKGEKADWSGVLGALTANERAVLLLPAEKIPSNTTLSSSFFIDHLALVQELPSTSTSTKAPRKAFVTLGGMRGFIDQNEIVFASHCPLDSTRDLNEPKVLRSVEDPLCFRHRKFLKLTGSSTITPSSILHSIQQDVTSASYPSIFLISTISKLAIPRPSSSRGAIVGITGGRAMPTGSSTSSRLAALFAKPTNDDLPPVVPAPPGLLSNTTTSTSEQSTRTTTTSTTTTSRHHLDVSVLTIGKTIRTKEMQKDVLRGTLDGIRKGLKSIEGCNENVIIERVVTFVQKIVPYPSTTPGINSSSTTPSIEEIADLYQDLSDATRVDLGRSIRTLMITSKGGEQNSFGASDFASLETRVDEALERVEQLLTNVLYDRLYSPSQASDVQEDDKLSSRIRGLRAMDLFLDHLGVDLDAPQANEEWAKVPRTMRESLEDVISLVGKELDRLSSDEERLRSPKAKLGIFVGVHQLIVDQLSELPPVPLKKDLSVNAASSSGGEVEMDDATSLMTIGSDSRSLSPTREVKEDEDSLLKTPTAATHKGAERDGLSPLAVPEISLAGSELEPSVEEALSSSVFDLKPPKETTPTPGAAASSKPTSIVEERTSIAPSSSKASSIRSRKAPASSSADLILPLLIYATLQHDPPLPSHLKYAQRFRAESLMRGEASYCATNIQAVIEFLTTVEVSSLGMIEPSASTNKTSLESGSTTTTGANSFLSSLSTRTSRASSISSLRKTTSQTLSQQVTSRELDQFVDQANRSLVNVVGMLFGPGGFAPKTIEDVKSVLDGAGNAVAKKATGGYLRRIHGTGKGSKMGTNQVEESVHGTVGFDSEGIKEGKGSGKEREMVDFVPGATDDLELPVEDYVEPDHMQEVEAEPTTTMTTGTIASDQRSIRSISSILRRDATDDRPSLGERIASFPGLSRFGPSGGNGATGVEKQATNSATTNLTNSGIKPSSGGFFSSAFASTSPSRSRRSTLSSLNNVEGITPITTAAAATMGVRPAARFLGIQVEELRVGQVGELLEEYQRLAKAFVALQEASMGGRLEGATGEGEGV
ncbi:BQ5605_C021g09345 [Microbotryum silenes-dioicae]|uniref:BQ5605_C021g09345 protein n=1 Tax=Microbotryum silenes-dioicae TaxID=796604 RepID=A0A2X0PKY0_9BASI|nr:BQ5605_C021g09345 [Microbotryum silenes-dioicae]